MIIVAFLAIPLSIVALAFVIHGFPNLITINKHYHNKDEE